MYYKIKLSEYIENDISEISNNLYFLSKSKEIAKNYYMLEYIHWIFYQRDIKNIFENIEV